MNNKSDIADVLESPDSAAVFFRAACSVGLVVRQRLPDILWATDETTGVSWDGVVRLLSQGVIDGFRLLGASSDYRRYVDVAKTQIAADSKTFQDATPELAEILGQIASAIAPLSTDDLRDSLNDMNLQGRALTIQCVDLWGSHVAQARAAQLPEATLTIELSDNAQLALRAHCDGQGEITLTLGKGPGLLLSFLSLDFYFLHEYLSHFLPLWDDHAGTFSEGYLFELGLWAFKRLSETPVTPVLLTKDMEMHRARRPNALTADLWEVVQYRAAWLRDRCDSKRPMASLLLELAVHEQDPRFRDRFLMLLKCLSSSGESRYASSVLCNDPVDLVAVHDELRAHFRERLGLKF